MKKKESPIQQLYNELKGSGLFGAYALILMEAQTPKEVVRLMRQRLNRKHQLVTRDIQRLLRPARAVVHASVEGRESLMKLVCQPDGAKEPNLNTYYSRFLRSGRTVRDGLYQEEAHPLRLVTGSPTWTSKDLLLMWHALRWEVELWIVPEAHIGRVDIYRSSNPSTMPLFDYESVQDVRRALSSIPYQEERGDMELRHKQDLIQLPIEPDAFQALRFDQASGRAYLHPPREVRRRNQELSIKKFDLGVFDTFVRSKIPLGESAEFSYTR